MIMMTVIVMTITLTPLNKYQKGVDVNIINNNGNTPLHEAADHLQTGIIRVLLEAGADPTIRNKLTQTALNLAKVSCWNEQACMLNPRLINYTIQWDSIIRITLKMSTNNSR